MESNATDSLPAELNSTDDIKYASELPIINIIRPSIEGHLACEIKREFHKVHPSETIEELNESIPKCGHEESNEGPSVKSKKESKKGQPAEGQVEKMNEQTNIVNAVQKLREQRMAREKARIEKLKQMNLTKYKSNEEKSLQNISKSNSGNNIRKSSAGHMIPTPSAGHSKTIPGKIIPKLISAHVFPKPSVPISKPKVGQISNCVGGYNNRKSNVGPSHSKPVVGNAFPKANIVHPKQNNGDHSTKPNVPSNIRMSTIPTYNKPLPITKPISVVPSTSKDNIISVIPPRYKNSKLNPVSMKKDIPPIRKNLNKDMPKKSVANDKNNSSLMVQKKITPHKFVPPKSNVRRTISICQTTNHASKVPTAHVKPMPSNSQIQRSKVPPPNRFTLSSIHRKINIPKVTTELKQEIPKMDTNISDLSSIKTLSENENDPHITDVRQALIDQVHGIEKHSTHKLSVFDRLSKPKHVTNKVTNTPQTRDKRFSQFVGKTPNKERHSMIPAKSRPLTDSKMRRSISSVHFKHLPPNQRKSCIHRSSSVSDSLNRKQIDEINEDEEVKDEVVYAVKSERKKTVKFSVPRTPGYLNTPSTKDLRKKLANWLHMNGRSLNSYQHLQCFGVNNLMTKPKFTPMAELQPSDDENKENVEISDDASFTDNLTDRQNDFNDNSVGINSNEQMDYNDKDFCFDDGAGNWDKWRRASYHMSDTLSTSVDLRDDLDSSQNESLVGENAVNEIINDALNDLLSLIQSGCEWEQCAGWLRAVRERYPASTDNYLYWECRAALEEKRGNFPRTMECWERAIIQGVKPSVVEASLDQLLDKFMKLQLDPKSAGTSSAVDLKLLDVKNVFKSTLIRFAVQQKQILESQTKHETTKLTATPVRRSSRLDKTSPTQAKLREEIKLQMPQTSVDNQGSDETEKTPENEKPLPKLTPYRQSATRSCRRTPLVQICSSLQQINEDVRKTLVFVPNKALQYNNSP